MTGDKGFNESDFRKVEIAQRNKNESFVRSTWNANEKREGYFQGAIDIITLHGKAALHHTLRFDKMGDLQEMSLEKSLLESELSISNIT